MKNVLVAFALLAACRGGHKGSKDAGLAEGSASFFRSGVSVVPKLPRTDDGIAELRAIDDRIRIHAKEPTTLIGLLLQRAGIRGHVEDYVAVLDESRKLVEAMPQDATAWKLRVQVLTRVHHFAQAREALAHVAAFGDPSVLVDPQAAIDDAVGNYDAALAARAQTAKDAPSPLNLTLYAATLAEAGKYDEALALLPKATTAVRLNTAPFINWLLFQWGRIYEQKGDLSIARDFYLEAYARLPGSVETVEHLVLTLNQTGDPQRAKKILDAAVAENPHPSLMGLALKVTGSDAASVIPPEAVTPVAAEWERYVKALPEAFADHAARFYLDAGGNPARARELAQLNFANRPSLQARALLVEATLAAGDAAAACGNVDPLIAAPTRAHRFIAWRALTACKRNEEAQRLGAALGI